MSELTAMGAVQRAVYARLHGDSTLMALAPVYDEVPSPPTFPFIEMSEFAEDPDDTLGGTGREVTATIMVYSREAGFKELEAILDRLLHLLHVTALTDVDSDWKITNCMYASNPGAEASRLPDGLTRQLAARFVVSIQATGG